MVLELKSAAVVRMIQLLAPAIELGTGVSAQQRRLRPRNSQWQIRG